MPFPSSMGYTSMNSVEQRHLPQYSCQNNYVRDEMLRSVTPSDTSLMTCFFYSQSKNDNLGFARSQRMMDFYSFPFNKETMFGNCTFDSFFESRSDRVSEFDRPMKKTRYDEDYTQTREPSSAKYDENYLRTRGLSVSKFPVTCAQSASPPTHTLIGSSHEHDKYVLRKRIEGRDSFQSLNRANVDSATLLNSANVNFKRFENHKPLEEGNNVSQSSPKSNLKKRKAFIDADLQSEARRCGLVETSGDRPNEILRTVSGSSIESKEQKHCVGEKMKFPFQCKTLEDFKLYYEFLCTPVSETKKSEEEITGCAQQSEGEIIGYAKRSHSNKEVNESFELRQFISQGNEAEFNIKETRSPEHCVTQVEDICHKLDFKPELRDQRITQVEGIYNELEFKPEFSEQNSREQSSSFDSNTPQQENYSASTDENDTNDSVHNSKYYHMEISNGLPSISDPEEKAETNPVETQYLEAPETKYISESSDNLFGSIDHLLIDADDKEKTSIHQERKRRIGEQHSMLCSRKLCLVLDLDHTLLNSVMFANIEPIHEKLLNAKRKKDHKKALRHIFYLPHIGMWTKLRPGVWKFLERASDLFELHVYTMGSKAYAAEMTKILDPTGKLFSGRVISKGEDFDVEGFDMSLKTKDLDGVMGMESSVVIIDDTEKVWPNHRDNLIVVERYHYFPYSRREYGLPGPSLLEIDYDEREKDGMLSIALKVIEQIHRDFFSKELPLQCDIRHILAAKQRTVLKDCKILFSRVFPLNQPEPHLNPLWQLAEKFGAACTTHIDDQVTHVVATTLGTQKVKWALSTGKHVVCPSWLEASTLLYHHMNEKDFPVRV